MQKCQRFSQSIEAAPIIVIDHEKHNIFFNLIFPLQTNLRAMSEAADPKEVAETLRLQGNDAFSTKDWERAMKLYRSSVAHAESAKAYSNLVCVVNA
jgi:hypothetical protein